MNFSALIPRIQLTLFLISLPAIALLPLFLLANNITLLPVILSTIVLATVLLTLSMTLVSKLQSRLNVFSNMVLAVKEGDVSQKLRLFNDDSFLDLAKAINELIDHAQQQQQCNKSSQLLLQKIVSNIDVAIIATDELGWITLANNKAQNLFLDPQSLVGQSTYTLGIHQLFNQPLHEPISFQFPNAKGRWQCFHEQFFDKGDQFELYFITDVSHLLRMEELKSWKNLLRVLSHEINNSLTPIASISQSMQQAVAHDEDLSEGLQLIHQRAKSLESFIKSYRQFTHLPRPQIQPVELHKMLTCCITLLADSRIELITSEYIEIDVDSALLEQVLINLLKNGIEACETQSGKVVVNYIIEQQSLILTVMDNGKGIANMANLFVPLYSTKKQGSGIGLLVSRQIIEAHGGELSLENNIESAGAIATITLPLH
ncbi:MAG: GHKL domain-containing protein [Alteromonadales bacterium]|nr:GHKL domain-containing protein [Alteromonadales bacterium]